MKIPIRFFDIFDVIKKKTIQNINQTQGDNPYGADRGSYIVYKKI